MIKFEKDNVLLLQKLIIESSGGHVGIRDLALVESALETAFQTFDGVELYPTKEEKGARLGYGLISNHAFLDGNKRIGILVMLSFLEINGVKLKYKDEELIELGMSLASSKIGYDELLNWIKKHKQKI